MSQSAAEARDGMVAGRRKHRPLTEFFIRLVREKPLGLIGGVLVVLFFLTGIFANFLSPYGYNEMDMVTRLTGPSGTHWLGSDNLGRDLLSRIIYGARISMVVGVGVPLIATVISLLVGGVSGYIGGKYDLVVQRFVDAWMAFPGLIIILTVMAIVGPGLMQVVVVLGVQLGLGGGSRTMRGAVIAIRENVYFEAARSIGASPSGVLTRHVLPNIMPVILVLLSTRMAGAILTEAGLSFLGYGIPPPMPSWGGMLSGAGRRYMLVAPWMALWPGIALSLVIYGVSMFGDAVRDLLDPRLRGGLGRYGVKKPKERQPKKLKA